GRLAGAFAVGSRRGTASCSPRLSPRHRADVRRMFARSAWRRIRSDEPGGAPRPGGGSPTEPAPGVGNGRGGEPKAAAARDEGGGAEAQAKAADQGRLGEAVQAERKCPTAPE